MTSQTQQQRTSFRQTAADKLTKGKQYLQVFGEIDTKFVPDKNESNIGNRKKFVFRKFVIDQFPLLLIAYLFVKNKIANLF